MTIAGQTGVVEEVALRHTTLRQHDGTVHFVPNGKIDTVTNRSRAPAQAISRSAGSG